MKELEKLLTDPPASYFKINVETGNIQEFLSIQEISDDEVMIALFLRRGFYKEQMKNIVNTAIRKLMHDYRELGRSFIIEKIMKHDVLAKSFYMQNIYKNIMCIMYKNSISVLSMLNDDIIRNIITTILVRLGQSLKKDVHTSHYVYMCMQPELMINTIRVLDDGTQTNFF